MTRQDASRAVGRPFEVGEIIGETYLLRRVLGLGGMSRVFEAEDVRISRRVAIKVLDDAELGATSLVLEAKALASVQHTGLPVVHGLAVHRGWTYLVLERLFGIDLEHHLEDSDGNPRRLDPHEGLPILASIADVLAAVHRAGMAHRDLKPGNVMLCAQRTVLLDFGIVIPEVDADHTIRCGTPRYLAPEIIQGTIPPGRAHLVDAYALGVLAFEMFAGRPPFEAESTTEMLLHHVSTTPPELASLCPHLPPPLGALVAACLAKDPMERPGDMETIAGDLRSILRRAARVPRAPMKVAELRETYRRAPVAEVPAIAAPIDPTMASFACEVLIVEDDEDLRDAVAAVLEARGFCARVAANGRDATDLVARTGRRPSVILLDLSMPIMDGASFLAHQSSNPTLDGVPVLLFTGEPLESALRFPSVRGVVKKPLEMPALLRRLGDVCLDSLPTLAMEPLPVPQR